MNLFESIFGKRASDPTGLELESPAPAPVNSRTAPGRYIPYSQAQLREFGCDGASTGAGLSQYGTRLSETALAAATSILTTYSDTYNNEEKRLAALEAERKVLLQPGAPYKDFAAPALMKGELDLCETSIARMMRLARDSTVRAWTPADCKALKEISVAEDEWIDALMTPAQKLLDVEKVSWEERKDELDRQVQVQQSRLKELRDALVLAKKRVEALYAAGITRHVSGFLVWAGYASFVGMFAVVGHLLKPLMQNPNRKTLVSEALGAITTIRDFLIFYAGAIGVLFATLVLVGGVTMLVRRLLHENDPAWRARPSSNGDGAEGWLGWLGMFGPKGVPKGTVTDHSLRQLIGALPLVFGAAVIALLLVAFGDRSGSGLEVMPSPIGPAFVLLAIVTAMLFATNLLDGQESTSPRRRMRIVLFSLLALAPSIALILAGTLPKEKSYIALTAVAIAMTLSASGLAFGLIYRGHFAKEDYLEREIARCEYRITMLRQRPTLANLVFARYGEISDLIRGDLRARFSDRQFWRNVRRRWKRIFLRLRNGEVVEQIDVSPADEIALSDAERTRLSECRALRDQLRARWERLTAVDVERQEAQSRMSAALRERVEGMRGVYVEYACGLFDMENAYDIALASLEGPRKGASAPYGTGPIPTVPLLTANLEGQAFHARPASGGH
jgi:hypothetical protein